jgi:hypothetical protein
MANKKAVKKVKNRIVSDEKVFNVDVLKYWESGKKVMCEQNDYELVAKGQTLHYVGQEDGPLAYRSLDGRLLINGDDEPWDEYRDDVVQDLQNYENANTTSFKCLEEAGISIDGDITVVDSQTDFSQNILKKDKRFANAEKNVPKGATLTVQRNFNKKTGKYTGAIHTKRIHRAGAVLLKFDGKTFIASMDERNYYVIECSKPAKSLAAAFNTLKPAKVRRWEKANKEEAKRQGEWYFIPAPKVKIDKEKGFSRVALPMKSDDSNAHVADRIQEIRKKQYVSGSIYHDDHDAVNLFDYVHEAIENTALNSWSIEGVD